MIAYCTVRYGKINVLQYQRPEWLTEKYLWLFQQGGWLVNLPKPGKFHFAHVSVPCGIFRRHYRVCLCHTISARVTHGRASVQV